MDSAALEALAKKLLPFVQQGLDVAVPPAAPVVNIVVDAIEALVADANDTPLPANATAAPKDTASRLTAIEQHVAALILAQSGSTTSNHVGALNLVRSNAAAAQAAAAITAQAAGN